MDQPTSGGLSSLHKSGRARKDGGAFPAPECAYLTDLALFKLLELPLEAQVGVCAGPARTHGAQGVFPAEVGDRHDVCHHQSHAPGDAGQAAGPRTTQAGEGQGP